MFEIVEQNLKVAVSKTTHVVIKLGTGILTPHISESAKDEYFHKLAISVQRIKSQGKQVVIVSSGAVGMGILEIREFHNIEIRKKREDLALTEKQALASVGQSILINTYRTAFKKEKLPVAQILVTKEDFHNRSHYNNLKNTLDQLLKWGVVPVVNENDAVALDELKFGDNDTLSANIAGMFPQTLLILMTTIDGFYFENQKQDLISEITDAHLKEARLSATGGIGGMRTKLKSALRILQSGQIMNIVSVDNPESLVNVLSCQKIGTWFFDSRFSNPLAARKRWLLHHKNPQGQLTIDRGAVKALQSGPASLLSVGLLNIEGDFPKNTIVNILDDTGNEIGRGITLEDSDTLTKMLSQKEHSRGKEIIHRDNLVLL